LTLKNGTNRLSQNVGTDHRTLRKIPEELRSHLRRGGSLKSPADERRDIKTDLCQNRLIAGELPESRLLFPSMWPLPKVSAIIICIVRRMTQYVLSRRRLNHLQGQYEFLTTVKMAGLFVTKAEAKIWRMFGSVRSGVIRQLMTAVTCT